MFKRLNTQKLLSNPTLQFRRMVHELSSVAEFRKATSEGKVMVDFYATWCGPCKAIAPIVDKLETQYTGVKFYKLDIDRFQEIANEQQISAVPTFMAFNNNKVVNVVRGADPGGIKAVLEELN